MGKRTDRALNVVDEVLRAGPHNDGRDARVLGVLPEDGHLGASDLVHGDHVAVAQLLGNGGTLHSEPVRSNAAALPSTKKHSQRTSLTNGVAPVALQSRLIWNLDSTFRTIMP